MMEKQIVKKIMKWLKTLPESYWVKVHADAANPGAPDISGCVRGRRVELEVKRPGGKATPLQLAKLRAWENAGALTAIVYSVDDAKEILRGTIKE